MNLVNSSNPTVPFRLEALGAGINAHWHDIQLTPNDVAVLRGGGVISVKVSSKSTTVAGVDPSGHTHTYTLACA